MGVRLEAEPAVWQQGKAAGWGDSDKKEAARSRIPGKNPKTQREEQPGRLVSRRREDAPDGGGVNGKFFEKCDFFVGG